MIIRRFQPEDAVETAQVIATTLKISNSKDYSKEYIGSIAASYCAQHLIEKAKEEHMYVACDERRIIGCGSITGYWGSAEESYLLTFFVLPEYQGKGIGRQIMGAIEQDEYFLRAKRIEVHASITAVGFYRKVGYTYKNGIAELKDGVYCLEKYR